jgi:hypothetical protein
MTTLSERITQDGITAYAAPRGQGAPSYTSDMDSMDWWNVTLTMHGRQMVIPFGMGSGHRSAEPTAHDVLSAILSDASSIENARDDFEEWAGDYGYDTDSRTAERTYNQTVKQTDQLRAFLGDLYDTYLWETEND